MEPDTSKLDSLRNLQGNTAPPETKAKQRYKA
jgi:hypothetical protein